jgi:hypothetical protein
MSFRGLESAPLASRRLTAVSFPLRAAQKIGVSPQLSFALISASVSKRRGRVEKLSVESAAQNIGVLPLMSGK